MLSIQHPPGNAIPEFDQRSDNCSHVCPSLRGKKTGDVFEDEPLRLELFDEARDLVEEPASLSSQASTSAGKAEVLAGESSDENAVAWCKSCCDELLTCDLRDVIE